MIRTLTLAHAPESVKVIETFERHLALASRNLFESR
jgi:hypothetical protein